MPRGGNAAIQVMLPLNIRDREGLMKIAEDWDLSLNDVVRRMARMLITGKITVNEILKNPIPVELQNGGACVFPVRFSLTAPDRAQLIALSEVWGFSCNQLLRRFIRALIAGDIPRLRLWESGKEK